MYENPYGGYRPYYQQPVQQSQLFGRPVDRQESIQANDVPMNMPYALFPKTDLSEIYLKSWSPNGAIQTVVFKPEIPKPMNLPGIDEKSKENAYSEATEDIMRRLDELSAQIQEIGNSIPKTRRTKKEGEQE